MLTLNFHNLHVHMLIDHFDMVCICVYVCVVPIYDFWPFLLLLGYLPFSCSMIYGVICLIWHDLEKSDCFHLFYPLSLNFDLEKM